MNTTSAVLFAVCSFAAGFVTACLALRKAQTTRENELLDRMSDYNNDDSDYLDYLEEYSLNGRDNDDDDDAFFDDDDTGSHMPFSFSVNLQPGLKNTTREDFNRDMETMRKALAENNIDVPDDVLETSLMNFYKLCENPATKDRYNDNFTLLDELKLKFGNNKK